MTKNQNSHNSNKQQITNDKYFSSLNVWFDASDFQDMLGNRKNRIADSAVHWQQNVFRVGFIWRWKRHQVKERTFLFLWKVYLLKERLDQKVNIFKNIKNIFFLNFELKRKPIINLRHFSKFRKPSVKTDLGLLSLLNMLTSAFLHQVWLGQNLWHTQ